jgi:hypothetical protein
MKVERYEGDNHYYHERREALQRLLTPATATATANAGRPCPGCELRCPSCGSVGCRCDCHAGCVNAPRAMSSAPEEFPVEPGIVPLVYALYDAGLAHPCWSCEGHNGADGKLHKLPAVWFYARHLAYPDLLADYLWQLEFAGRIAHRWTVGVVSSDNSIDTTFSIAPAPDGTPELAALRRDIGVIGESLAADVRSLARRKLASLDSHIRALGVPAEVAHGG